VAGGMYLVKVFLCQEVEDQRQALWQEVCMYRHGVKIAICLSNCLHADRCEW
jgi:hypothetical protein